MGVVRTSDGGEQWSLANMGLPDPNVSTLAIDPDVPTTLYAGTSLGIFASTDGPNRRENAETGEIHNAVRLLTAVGGGRLYAAAGGGVIVSTDRGSTWSTTNPLAPVGNTDVTAVAVDPLQPGTVYAGKYGSDVLITRAGVEKSTDRGASWTQVSSGPQRIRALAVDPNVPDTLYVGTSDVGFNVDFADTRDGVFKSSDAGSSWSGLLQDQEVLSVAVDPTTSMTLYAGTAGGVMQSRDGGGDSWQPATVGLPGGSRCLRSRN